LQHYSPDKKNNMQAIAEELQSKKTSVQPFIFRLQPSALSGIPFHTDTDAISRYAAAGFPLHMAVHQVSPLLAAPPDYTLPHIHDDSDEVNLIVSTGSLVYKIRIGNNDYTVYNNSAIWIPRGMVHAANVLEGSGYFIALRLP
jgi:mannose-6-phosphate isomerase-like protein (cupin superfamily)